MRCFENYNSYTHQNEGSCTLMEANAYHWPEVFLLIVTHKQVKIDSKTTSSSKVIIFWMENKIRLKKLNCRDESWNSTKHWIKISYFFTHTQTYIYAKSLILFFGERVWITILVRTNNAPECLTVFKSHFKQTWCHINMIFLKSSCSRDVNTCTRLNVTFLEWPRCFLKKGMKSSMYIDACIYLHSIHKQKSILYDKLLLSIIRYVKFDFVVF